MLTLFSCWIILKNQGIIVNTDLNVHLLRLEGLTRYLKSGIFYPYINTEFFNGFGYASDMFYGNLFIYIGAVYRVLTGASLIAGYKVMIVTSIFFTFVCCYYSIRSLSNSIRIGLFSSILYTLSTVVFTMLSSGTIGQLLAFMLIPVVFSSYFQMVEKNKNTILPLVLSISGILLTHILTLLMLTIILAIATILNYRKLWENKLILYRLSLSAIFTLLITAFFTLPLFEQIQSQPLIGQLIPTFYVSSGNTSLWDELSGSLSNSYGLFINMIILIIIFVRLFIYRKKITGDGFVLTGFLLVLTATKEFPWFLFDHTLLNNIQFPSRIMIFSTFFLAVGASFYIDLFIKDRYISKNKSFVIILLSVLVVNVSLVNQYLKNTKSADHSVQVNSVQTGGREYLPVGIVMRDSPLDQSQYSDNPDKMFGLNTDAMFSKPLFKEIYNNAELSHIDDGISYSQFSKKADVVSFYFNNSKEGEVSLPLIYYKGYVTEIKQGNNVQLTYSYAGETNLVSTKLPKGDGTAKIYYYGTPIQKYSRLISIFGLFALLLYVLFPKKLVEAMRKEK